MTTHQILSGPGSGDSTRAPDPAPTVVKHPLRVVLVVAFATLVTTLNQTLVVPVLPELPGRLGVTPSIATWLVTATVIAGAVSHPVLGRLGDQFDAQDDDRGARRHDPRVPDVRDERQHRRPHRRAGAPGDLQCDDPARDEPGGGGPGAKAPRLRHRLRQRDDGAGGALGLPTAGLVSRLWGFHGLFAVSAVAGAIAVAALLLAVPAPPRREHTQRVDLFGAVLLTCFIVTLLVGLDRGGEWGGRTR